MGNILDTNIWLYALLEGQDTEKASVAKELIRNESLVISTQIINEVCVNLIRKAQLAEDKIREIIAAFYRRYPILDQDSAALVTASELREEYSLSFWDSLIVSVALHNEVPVLYSEDMHHGLIVREVLEIVDPFVILKKKGAENQSKEEGQTEEGDQAREGDPDHQR